jgi:hypothetical protein
MPEPGESEQLGLPAGTPIVEIALRASGGSAWLFGAETYRR